MTEISFHHVALTCGSVARPTIYCDILASAQARLSNRQRQRDRPHQNGLVFRPVPKSERPIQHLTRDRPPVGLRHIASVSDGTPRSQIEADRNVSLRPLTFDAFIPGLTSVWIKDPDGNLVELSQGYKDA
jgi:glyoxylase I family protein